MSFFPRSHAPDDDDLSAEEVRQLRRRRIVKRTIISGLSAVLLIGIAVVLIVPLVKNWRARQFTARAEELRSEGKLQDAFNNASSAFQMRPGMPEVRRTYARVLVDANESAALQIMQELADSDEGTPEDRLALAEAGLRFGNVALAEKEAFQLLQQGDKAPQALYVVARVRLAQNRRDEALQALKESVESGGGPDPAILLARSQLADGKADSLRSAIGILRPIARQKDAPGLQALLALVGSPALRTAEGADWIEALRTHPLATTEQKLAASSAEIELRPTARAEVVRKTAAAYRNGPPDQRAALARWLNLNREYATTLDVITANEASARSDLFLIRLDAMAGRGEWQTIAELLRGNALPLQSALVWLYRGRAARELGREEESATHYRRAIIESAPARDIMWYVISYLQRIGEDKVLEEELESLTENPATARQAFAALVPLVQKRQDAEELYQLYDRMLKQLPADTVVQNDHRYFAALTGRRADVGGGRDLLAKEPQMLAYRITLALTHLRSGQNEAAMRVFDGITLDPAQIQPYQRAVLAAVLGANGREAEARQLAESVPGDQVTAQEYKLIEPWRDGGGKRPD